MTAQDNLCPEHENHKPADSPHPSALATTSQLFELAELFKMFSDSTRIRIFCALFRQELCVAGIAEHLDMGQSAISHQLRLLRTAGLVKTRREGKSIFYSLDDVHVELIFEMGLQHILEKEGDE